jgi:2-methylcitrate dehydratase PrpD
MDDRLTRREIFQRAGVALAALSTAPTLRAAEPARRAAEAGAAMDTLSQYMAGAARRALPPEVEERVKYHLLDTLAAMVSGADLPPGIAAMKFARTVSRDTGATIAASSLVAGPIDAALVNGVLAHSDETDDSHAPSLSHPGCAVVPAALAGGEHLGIDGARLLRAVALGYDVGPRTTIALGGPPVQTEAHKSTHSIAGVFGAAAAAGSAAGLDARQMRWLLDYTAQQSSGIASWQRDVDHIEKGFVFGGMPARSGTTAAMLVHAGWTGVDDVLSGADNFFMAYATKAEPAAMVDQLGSRYEVTRTNIKKWTVGSPIQAPLDAVELLLKKRPFTADQVRQVVVRVATNEASIVNNREIPDICLQHMVALMLVDGNVTFKSAHDTPRMKDAAVLRQRAKVQLVPDEELERRRPRREATVEITLADGSQLREHVSAVRGTAENPMTRDEVVGKCRDLLAPTLGAASAGRLIDTVLSLERTTNVRSLKPLLQRR